MLMGPPIPEIQLFKELTLKIQGQGHGWNRSSKLQCESNIMNILSTHIPLVPCRLALPFLRYSFFKVWPWKIQGQGHSSRSQSRYNTLSTRIPFVPCQSALPFLGYSYFKIWHWKFKVKVISEVKVESHNEGTTFSGLTSLSFHVNRASHSWVGTFQNLTLKIKGQGHASGHTSKSQCGSKILSTHIPFFPCQSGIPFLSYDFFKIWPWKSRVKVHPIDSHPFRSMSIGHPIPKLRLLQNLTWKSRVKVMGEVTLQSQNGGLISYRLTFLSPHANRPSYSWHTAFSKFDLENPGSRSNDHDVAQPQVQTIP